MLRTDRVSQLAELLAAELDALPAEAIEAALPPTVATALRLVRKLGRVDLIGEVRRSGAAMVRQLPARCEADPAAAQAVLDRAVGIVAWLDDQTDAEPDLRLLS